MTGSFVGRRRELRHLGAALDDAAASSGELYLLAGEPGIGKTRLAEEVASRAAAAGFVVAWGACWEGARAQPYWSWMQVLREIARAVPEAAPDPVHPVLAGILSEGPPGGPERPPGGIAPAARLELFDAIADLLRRAANRRPLLLVIDDLHWADPASVMLLSFLASRLHGTAVLILATYRTGEFGTGEPGGIQENLVAELLRLGRHIGLVGLGAGEIGDLAERIGGRAPTAGEASSLHGRTGGNPLFAQELVRLLDLQGGLDPGTQPGVVPVGVEAVISRRLGRLSPGCRSALELASVLGTTFALDTLAAMASLEPVLVADVLGEAEAAHLVTLAGDEGSFVHALVRDSLYEQLTASRRGALHRQAVEALEAVAATRTVGAAELAHHGLLTGEPPSARTIAHLRAAGTEAMRRLAYEDAAGHYAAAARALEAGAGEDLLDVLAALGAAHLAAGAIPQSRADYLRLARVARELGQAEPLAQAALGIGSGPAGFEVTLRDPEQIELLEEALARLGPEPCGLRAWLLARLSVALAFGESEGRRLGLAEEAVAMARDAGDPGALAYALAAHCDAVPGPEYAELRRTTTQELLRLAADLHDQELQLMGRRLRLVALLETGRMAEVDAEIDAYARTAAARHQPLYGWYVPAWRAMRAHMAGRIDTCRELMAEADRLGRQAHSANAFLHVATLRWCLNVDLADGDDIARMLEEFDLLSIPGVWPHIAYAGSMAAMGRPSEARSQLDVAAPLLPDAPRDGEWLAMLSQAARVVSAIGGHPIAIWLYDVLLPHRHVVVVEGAGAAVRGLTERYLGLLAATLGRLPDALEHFGAALAGAVHLGAPLIEAGILRDWGVALADAGRLEQAQRLFLGLGITGWISEIEVSDIEVIDNNRFRCEGEVWSLSFAGREVRMRDAKGLRDLARLLARPGQPIAALDLAATGPPVATGGDLGEVLDAPARDAYRRRLKDLEAEVDEAQDMGDLVRAGRAGSERDAIIDALSAAYGLGGRPRMAGHPAERARSTVTARIRDTIARIEHEHPDLGRHLRRSVRTGTFCVYDPDEPQAWEL